MATAIGWTRAAALEEVEPGGAKAVRVGEGRSIALFNVDGRIYATDNQCPHMGYPLTRGAIRNGVLTCDWHGRRFDLEGGGCFNNMCDDLEVFPVELRGGEIWILPGDGAYRRREQHLRLLREGLLHQDRWTISKAIALMLRGQVPESDIVGVILRHFGRHVASSRGADAGVDLARFVNGIAIGRRYDGEDRLMALATAATSAAGEAAERLEVVTLPEPVTWDRMAGWVRLFSRNGQENRIERCLFTARAKGDEGRILPLLYECAAQPGFLGFSGNFQTLGYLAELTRSFGWEDASELILNLGAKTVGQRRGEPQLFKRDAIDKMISLRPEIDSAVQMERTGDEYDEDALVDAVSSVDIDRSFDAIAAALASGVRLERLITTFVLLAADRMARTPVNVDAGWECLTRELNLARSLRAAGAEAGDRVAVMGLFHLAWQLFDDRWLNIPVRLLGQTPECSREHSWGSEEEGIAAVSRSLETLQVADIGDQVLAYLQAGFDGSRLLHELGRLILWNDTGPELLPTLRTIREEWEAGGSGDAAAGAGHPSRAQLLVALARYATDIRTNAESGSATTTAMRFAEGRTTVDVFDD